MTDAEIRELYFSIPKKYRRQIWRMSYHTAQMLLGRLPTPIGPVPFWRKWWSWFHKPAGSPTASAGAR